MKPAPRRAAKTGQRASPRGWDSLPRGAFTGVDWSKRDAMARSDPYLAWAETTGFAGFRSPQGQRADPQWLPLLIELNEDVSVADLVAQSDATWLQIPPVYQGNWPALRFCTARAKRGFFDAMAPGGALHALVKRFELGLPVGRHAQGLDQAGSGCAATSAEANEHPARIGGHVMVLIDNGLAVGHTDFLTAQGRSKVAAFWRQDATVGPHGRAAASTQPTPLDPLRAGPTPTDMGYGHELSPSRIQAAIQAHTRGGRLDEDGLYQHLQMWELNHAAHHGTHVSSLAAGPRIYTDTIGTEESPPNWAPANDAASRASMIVVQLDWTSVADSSGGALNVSVLDALAYALSRCAGDAQVVINLSWGALAGSHNGTSMLETGMAQLIASSGIECQLVIPAGNAYQDRTHANAQLNPRASATLHWRVQPDDHSQSFLELWFEDAGRAEAELKHLEIVLTPPGAAKPLKAMKIGHSGTWPTSAAPQCAVLFPKKSALGAPGACAVLALAPTASWFPGTVLARPGVWAINVVNKSAHTVIMDAYVERDDVPLGVASTGARQSYLEDPCYDTEGGLDGFIDQPDNPSLVRRSGTFNDLASGAGTASVGGIRYFASCEDPMARYSPRSPDPDAGRPERANVQKVPDRFAVSDDHATLWGVRAAGTRSAAVVRLVGTSMAAPQVARNQLDQLGGVIDGALATD
jgi:hypothetical protein